MKNLKADKKGSTRERGVKKKQLKKGVSFWLGQNKNNKKKV